MDSPKDREKPLGLPFKIFLILLFEVILVFVLGFLFGFLSAILSFIPGVSDFILSLIQQAIKHPILASAIDGLFFAIFCLYFAMIPLRKEYVPEDVRLIPRWLAIFSLCFGLLSAIPDHSLFNIVINVIIGPALQYLISWLFLRNRFSKKS